MADITQFYQLNVGIMTNTPLRQLEFRIKPFFWSHRVPKVRASSFCQHIYIPSFLEGLALELLSFPTRQITWRKVRQYLPQKLCSVLSGFGIIIWKTVELCTWNTGLCSIWGRPFSKWILKWELRHFKTQIRIEGKRVTGNDLVEPYTRN